MSQTSLLPNHCCTSWIPSISWFLNESSISRALWTLLHASITCLDDSYTPHEAPWAYPLTNWPLFTYDWKCCSMATSRSLFPWPSCHHDNKSLVWWTSLIFKPQLLRFFALRTFTHTHTLSHSFTLSFSCTLILGSKPNLLSSLRLHKYLLAY